MTSVTSVTFVLCVFQSRSTSDSQFHEVEEVDVPPSELGGVEPELVQEEAQPQSHEVEGAGPPSPEVEVLEPSSAEVTKSRLSEGVGDAYALSITLPQEEEEVCGEGVISASGERDQ